MKIAASGIVDIIPYMTSNETIIVGLCCLFLALAFLLFKPQFFILLNRLAKIEFRGAKNLKYVDQDLEPELPNADQDFKIGLSIPSWITLTGEKFTARIIIFVILSTLITIAFTSFSGILVNLAMLNFQQGMKSWG